MIDIDSGKVVGIISRKETGLSKQFVQLRAALEQNIALLKSRQVGGAVTLMGVDPIQSMIATQQQLDSVAREIERSANVGIGFAVKATALRDEHAFTSQ